MAKLWDLSSVDIERILKLWQMGHRRIYVLQLHSNYPHDTPFRRIRHVACSASRV